MGEESKLIFHKPLTPIMQTITPSVPDLSLVDNNRSGLYVDEYLSPNFLKNSRISQCSLDDRCNQMSEVPDTLFSSRRSKSATKRPDNVKDSRSGLKSKIISVITDQNNQLLELQKQILNLLEGQRIQPNHISPKSDVSTQTCGDLMPPLAHDASSNTSFSWSLLRNSMKTLSDASVQTSDVPCENFKSLLESSGGRFPNLKTDSSVEESLGSISIDSSDLPSLSQWPDDESEGEHPDISNLKVMIDRINGILEKENNSEQRKRILNVKEATINQLKKLGIHLNPHSVLDESPRAFNQLLDPTVNYMSILACASEDNGIDFNAWALKYCSNTELFHNESDVRSLEIKRSQVCIQDATHMTMYGLQPSNLSFATKKYLKKYGLLPRTEFESNIVDKFHPKSLSKPANHRKYNETVSTTNILDIDLIRNQPKLL